MQSQSIKKEVHTMKNDITEVVFILDRSGSMSDLTGDTIGGFNSILKEQRGKEGTVYVTTVLFNGVNFKLHDRLLIEEVPEMTDKDYVACGSTALVDAIGETIKHIEKIHKYARPEDVPEKTLFIITTDGMENASCKYSADEVKKMVSTKQEQDWEFIFLAANIDAVETAKHYGINANDAVNYIPDTKGTGNVYGSMNNAISECRQRVIRKSAWRVKTDEDYNLRK